LLEKPADQSGDSTTPVTPAMPYYFNIRYLQQMMRYGIPLRGLAPITPPPETPQTAPSRGGLQTVLDEKPFRVIMWVESVIVKDLDEVKAQLAKKKTSRPASPAPSATGDGATTSETATAESAQGDSTSTTTNSVPSN
ncbi:MAG: hypothetical protein N3G20_10045, partial [Verrucomicrobiae bacterium]|nr:hypothetical protein [Verrucomicrobiae bacterium]